MPGHSAVFVADLLTVVLVSVLAPIHLVGDGQHEKQQEQHTQQNGSELLDSRSIHSRHRLSLSRSDLNNLVPFESQISSGYYLRTLTPP
jgi:hypothetical protein